MRKYYLGEIINKNTQDSVCSHYTNRYIDDVNIVIGEPLRVSFENSGMITHEDVVDIEETDYGFWVETVKKLWRFDCVSDSINEVDLLDGEIGI